MVLYQSGQDTEMGGITCRLGNVLGSSSDIPQSGSPKKKMATTTLDQFWSTTLKKTHDDKGYDERGIFHSLPSLDADAFGRCGQTYETVDTSSFAAGMGASAKADGDMQAAIEMSRRQHEQNQNDKDLEEALRRSREEAGGASNAFEDSKPAAIDLAAEDVDLKRALELSMTTSSGAAGKNPAEMVDLTRPEPTTNTNANKKKPATVSNPEIIILDDDDDAEEKKEEETPKSSSMKRPSESPCPSSKRKAKKKNKSPAKVDDDRELKRKLAAEAAMKRFQGIANAAEEKKGSMEKESDDKE
ncbi:MAG: hypothetical protein SGARI_004246 [Bacillariaceae sp.]